MRHTLSQSESRRGKGDRHSFVGTGIGNALEWFDWSIYSTFAPFFAASFFDDENRISALLGAFAVFAVGFVARPLGGMLFGMIGDRVGRRSALSLTVVVIALGGFMIGVTPTFETIGVAASVLLVVARVLQGLAFGGEQPIAGSYLSEQAPQGKRGLWASLINSSGTAGALVGVLIGAALTAGLGVDAVEEWAWRIPFILSGLGGIVALIMRRKMPESQTFTESITIIPAQRTPLGRDLWQLRGPILQVIGLNIGVAVAYYYWTVSVGSYSIAVLGADPTGVLLAGSLSAVILIAILPLWGMLSDRIGRRPVMLIGTLGSVALMFPLSQLVDGDPVHLAIATIIANGLLAAPSAITPAIMAEIFPTRHRVMGVAVPLAVTMALFGGTAPYLQTWLATSGYSWVFLWYVVVLLILTALTVVRMPETYRADLSRVHEHAESAS